MRQKIKLFSILILGGWLASCSSESNPPEQEAPVDVLFVGHSQVNHQMPGYFNNLTQAAGFALSVNRQVIGGANLEENYVLSYQSADSQDGAVDPNGKYLYFPGRISAKGVRARAAIAAGSDHVIITEEHGLTQAQARANSSFQSTYGISFPPAENVDPTGDSYLLSLYQSTYELGSGLSFYHEAVTANPSAQVYLYENFFPVVNGATHCSRFNGAQPTKTLAEINSWRKRIFTYKNVWQGLATEMNNRRGQTVPGFSYGSTALDSTSVANGAAVEVIPVAQALSVLVERVCAGQVGSLTNPNELWLDHVHGSQLADYFIALVMYAAVYNESPLGVSLAGDGLGMGLDGSNLVLPEASVAAAMQQIASDVVNGVVLAHQTDIASCLAINNLPLTSDQICMDSGDNETIPSYP